MDALTEEEIARYSRQLLLQGWGAREQLRLRQIVVGLPVELPSTALYLAAAGVGTLAFTSFDGHPLELDNPFFDHLRSLNSSVTITGASAAQELDYLVQLSAPNDEGQQEHYRGAEVVMIVSLESAATTVRVVATVRCLLS